MPPKRPPPDYEAQIGTSHIRGLMPPAQAPPQIGTPFSQDTPPQTGWQIERFSPAFGSQLGMPFPVVRPARRINLPIGNPRGSGAFGQPLERRPVVTRPASGAVGRRLAGAAAAESIPPPAPREQAPASGGATAAESGFVPTHAPILNAPQDIPLVVARGLMSLEEYNRRMAGSR